jgi:hypothetical protein
VITNGIHRSGVTNSRALRWRPTWCGLRRLTCAVSARGFQNVITNKLLVLLDAARSRLVSARWTRRTCC